MDLNRNREMDINTLLPFITRFRKIAKNDSELRHVCLSVSLSAMSSSAPIGRIFMKFDIRIFLENL